MAVVTYQWRNDPAETSARPRQFFVCDTSAEKPVTGLLEGDMAYAKDVDTLYIADSATTWDAFAGGGGGASTLDDLTDVVITTPSDDQYLRYNGTNWVNETVAASGYTTLKDAGSAMTQRSVADFQDGFVLTDDGAETEVDLDYGTTTEIADTHATTEAAGTSSKVARADHVHLIGTHGAKRHTFVGVKTTVSGATATNDTTWTSVAYAGADETDTDTFHDTATNNTRITIPSGMGGKYHLIGQIIFDLNSTGDRFVRILKNGTTVIAIDSGKANALSNHRMNLSTTVPLVATDYVELQGLQTSGGALNMTNSTDAWFSAEYRGS